jgi:hypothetical protein
MCLNLGGVLAIPGSSPSKLADFIFPVDENSKYFTAVKPEPNTEVDGALPHVTIELPVYKESLG